MNVVEVECVGDGVILRFLSVIRLDTFDYTNVIGFVVNLWLLRFITVGVINVN